MSDGAYIHPSAHIEDGAKIGDDVTIGPYSIVGPAVEIEEGARLGPHVVVEGRTKIGKRSQLYQFCSVGAAPQDLKYAGEDTLVEIGADNIIREFVTINRGTAGGGGVTRLGDGNLVMAYAHVAHDCSVGNRVVLANAATLAGHVQIEDRATVGGLVAVHQFVRIGQGAFLGGGAMVSLDVPPFCIAAGDRASLHGLNVIGLRRSGLSEETIKELRSAYRTLFQSSKKLKEALQILRDQQSGCAEVQHLADFIEASERGVCR